MLERLLLLRFLVKFSEKLSIKSRVSSNDSIHIEFSIITSIVEVEATYSGGAVLLLKFILGRVRII